MYSSLFGIGCDICSIPRFSSLLSRGPGFSTRLATKILHPNELSQFLAATELRRSEYLASRWSVKESFIKAFGRRVLFPEIEISRQSTTVDPRPKIIFHGDASKMIKEAGIGAAHVSLSHEKEFAISYVILERRSEKELAE